MSPLPDSTDRIEPGRRPIDLGPCRLGLYSLVVYHRPFRGEIGSGDRLLLRSLPGGQLVFLVADAAGHGGAGDAVWRACGEATEELWSELCNDPSRSGVERFAGRLNGWLYDLEDESVALAHLALSVGVLTPEGRLEFASFGYGVHLLAAMEEGLWWGEPETLFGLKLGWLPTAVWETTPRAFVGHSISGVRRVVILTDGFLGDDFADAGATLEEVRILGEACASAPSIGDAAALVRSRPHDDDDAAFVAVDVPGERSAG